MNILWLRKPQEWMDDENQMIAWLYFHNEEKAAQEPLWITWEISRERDENNLAESEIQESKKY
jgi:hypothetical protein